jgi:Ca-activated chloride channel family protein
MKQWIPLLMWLPMVAGNALADGLIVIHDPAPVPQWHSLEVVYHHVNVKIDGQIATTSVDQEFYNPSHQRLEGTYLFPVPKGAQIDKFTMEIGGKQVAAELLPADKARKLYEDIVRKMRDPALLEYADRDTFKVRIFPIEPRSNKRVTLSYTQILKADTGLIGYLYPLNTEKYSAAPIKDVSVKIELDAHRPLKSIYSPSHSVEITRHGDDRATIGFEGHNIRPDTDFQVFWQTEERELGVNLLTCRERGEDGYFLLLASPGANGKREPVVNRDIVFVLDTSGSMAGSKLAQAKRALQFCVENLNDGDRFEIVRFSTEAEPLFEKLVPPTESNRQRAAEFIRDLKPIGGTAIEEALTKALALRPDVVIFLTDGQPTIGHTSEDEIVAGVKSTKARIFCFGIGTDVNTHLLDRISEQTRAFTQYVLPEEDLEVKVSNFYTKIKEPVITDPVLRFTGDVRASKLYPSPLPDIFRGDQLVVVGRYSGDGSAAVIIEGKDQKFAYDVRFPERAHDHEFIPRLWATRRIGYLLDEIRLHGENRELKEEVTELARRYGIVTPYTAYLIVEDEKQLPEPIRLMQQFGRDDRAKEEAGRAWNLFNVQKDGAAAVTGARASDSFKQAGQFAADSITLENTRALNAAAPVSEASRIVQYTQQSRFVNGRAFYQNGSQWIDANVQKVQNARRQQVKFGSDDYFALLARYPRAAQWFSVGKNVQLELDNTVYEITE